MQLTPAQLAQYVRDSFLIFPDLFTSAEIAARAKKWLGSRGSQAIGFARCAANSIARRFATARASANLPRSGLKVTFRRLRERTL